jgi:hypothetical protein
MQVVQDICDAISNKRGNLQDQLVKAAYCFEHYLGMPSDAWSDDVKNSEIDQRAVFKLRSVLIGFIEANQTDVNVGTAVWAFSKIANPDDKDFLIRLLSIYIENDPQVLYQIMCALSNVGESIFDGNISSLVDYEQNISLAKKYLNQMNC